MRSLKAKPRPETKLEEIGRVLRSPDRVQRKLIMAAFRYKGLVPRRPDVSGHAIEFKPHVRRRCKLWRNAALAFIRLEPVETR